LSGFINIKIARKIWLVCVGGQGMGNVDIKHIKAPPAQRFERSARIARYISKYISKSFETDQRFNKKRYWCSRCDMPAVRRIVMKAVQPLDVVREFLSLMGLSAMGVFGSRFDFFQFPGLGNDFGFWMNYQPSMADSPPPF
jgi:hypothetical protein